MKMRALHILAAMTSLSLAACGSGGSQYSQFYGWDSAAQFRIVQLDPIPQEENFAISNPVRVVANQPIDPATMNAGFKITETLSSGASTDITSTGTLSLSASIANNDTITFMPANNFIIGARYQVQITASIKSASGLPISPFAYRFTTGTWDMISNGLTVSGPPLVASMMLTSSRWFGVCPNGAAPFAVAVSFNEDLVNAPMVQCNYQTFIGRFDLGMEYLQASFTVGIGARTFIMEFADGGCAAKDPSSGIGRIMLNVQDALDLKGVHITPGQFKKEFDVGRDF